MSRSAPSDGTHVLPSAICGRCSVPVLDRTYQRRQHVKARLRHLWDVQRNLHVPLGDAHDVRGDHVRMSDVDPENSRERQGRPEHAGAVVADVDERVEPFGLRCRQPVRGTPAHGKRQHGAEARDILDDELMAAPVQWRARHQRPARRRAARDRFVGSSRPPPAPAVVVVPVVGVAYPYDTVGQIDICESRPQAIDPHHGKRRGRSVAQALAELGPNADVGCVRSERHGRRPAIRTPADVSDRGKNSHLVHAGRQGRRLTEIDRSGEAPGVVERELLRPRHEAEVRGRHRSEHEAVQSGALMGPGRADLAAIVAAEASARPPRQIRALDDETASSFRGPRLFSDAHRRLDRQGYEVLDSDPPVGQDHPILARHLYPVGAEQIARSDRQLPAGDAVRIGDDALRGDPFSLRIGEGDVQVVVGERIECQISGEDVEVDVLAGAKHLALDGKMDVLPVRLVDSRFQKARLRLEIRDVDE